MENYYEDALKLGKKCYKQSLSRGEYPYLPVLDEMMPTGGSNAGIDVGIIELPIEFVIGTKTRGRTRSFARNFMPLAEEKSEFAAKWKRLCDSHLDEGIRDPVEVWEYMNRFYVQEGNKRVSVLKYFGAVTVTARVKRILPVRNGDDDVERYYEFLDFCSDSGLHYIECSRNGAYRELISLTGKSPGKKWTSEERQEFSSIYYKFEKVYLARGGSKLTATVADAMLGYIRLYGYDVLKSQTNSEIKKTLGKIWDEIELQQEANPIDVKLNPEEEKESFLEKAARPLTKAVLPLNKIMNKKPLRIAFLYSTDIETSRWNANHDMGRQHIEKVFGEAIETAVYIRDAKISIDENLEKIIDEGAKVIFVTESKMVEGCVRVAIAHPEVAILNCSLNKPHRYIRTYYPRMYEAKFITGAIAGALTQNARIGYICKYPIYGMIAEINAFARGVSMVNPDARIYLEWSSICGITEAENRLREREIHLISYRDFYDQKSEAEIVFGLTDLLSFVNTPVALPTWNWSVFYEKIVDSILKGTYKDEYKKTSRALNYYWGMSSGAVDIVFSRQLPQGVRYLAESLCKAIRAGIVHPFYQTETQKDGQINWETSDRSVDVENIITMNYLEPNIIGEIPRYNDLEPKARELVDEIGVFAARPDTGK